MVIPSNGHVTHKCHIDIKSELITYSLHRGKSFCGVQFCGKFLKKPREGGGEGERKGGGSEGGK